MSNMMNRNLRIFEGIKSQIKRSMDKEIYDWERDKKQATQLFNKQDFDSYKVYNRILTLGFDEPHLYYNTVCSAQEKY